MLVHGSGLLRNTVNGRYHEEQDTRVAFITAFSDVRGEWLCAQRSCRNRSAFKATKEDSGTQTSTETASETKPAPQAIGWESSL